jgi:uncharacterized delta-60 repeat protein
MYIINFNFNTYILDENHVQNENLHRELKISFNEVWSNTWDAGVDEFGRGIAINEMTGDLYVTGYNSSTGNDGILIYYDSEGIYQGDAAYIDINNEYFYDVAVDSAGYIYAAGANGTTYPSFDVLLVKFNPAGEVIWNRSYDSGLYDGAWSLEIDSEDNIYVGGQTYTTSDAILLLKYNSSGDLQWSTTFDDSLNQVGRDLVLDSSNNIYVTGLNRPGGSFDDFLVVKFNSSGNHLWNRTWGGSEDDEGWGLAIDSHNDIYVTGFTLSYGAIQKDFIVVKYDNEGNWLWNRTWGTTASDDAYGIAVDSADNIYVGGYGLGTNVSIVKYDTLGHLLWYEHWKISDSSMHFCYDLIIDSLDKLYITGYNNSGPADDLFIAKFSIESPGKCILTHDPGLTPDDGNFGFINIRVISQKSIAV